MTVSHELPTADLPSVAIATTTPLERTRWYPPAASDLLPGVEQRLHAGSRKRAGTGLLEHSEETFIADLSREIEPAVSIPTPRELPLLSYVTLQESEGWVESIDKKTVWARMRDVTADSPDEGYV